MKNIKIEKYWLTILLVLFFPAIWALFVPGFFGASDDIHIAWLFEMDRSLKSGQMPPRYVPDLSYGFGYPLFNFVFPLPFYVGEAFHLLGLSLVDSIKAVFLLATVLSGVFMYLLMKNLVKTTFLAILGSVLYVYAPYRATDLYIRGAIGEIVAFAFLPLIALSVLRVTEEKFDKKWLGFGGLAVAGLALSHNITTYMFLPFIFIFGVIRLVFLKSKDIKRLFSFLGIFLFGLLITLYFWLPALLESGLMKYDTVFDFRDHYPTLKQLITPYFGYGASVPGPYDGLSFFLGYAGVLLPILSLIYLIIKWRRVEKDKKIIYGWVVGSFLFIIFLMNYRSTFLWFNLPLLGYFQFPWRFLIMTSFLTPIFLIVFDDLKFIKSLGLLLIIIVVGVSFSYFKPADFLGRMDNYFLNRYIPYPEASLEYGLLNEEYLRLPKENEMRPKSNYPTVFPENSRVKEVINLNSLDSLIKIESEEEFLLNYNKYNFPGWVAEVDNKKIEIQNGKPFSQIQVMLPAGIYNLHIYFKETFFRGLMNIVSLVSFLGVLIFLLRLYLSKNKL